MKHYKRQIPAGYSTNGNFFFTKHEQINKWVIYKKKKKKMSTLIWTCHVETIIPNHVGRFNIEYKWAMSWYYGTFRPPTKNQTSSLTRWLRMRVWRMSLRRIAMALVRLLGCAGSPKPSLVACMISTIISWAGSNVSPIQFNPNYFHWSEDAERQSWNEKENKNIVFRYLFSTS